MALAAFIAGTLLFLFLVRAGGLLVQRERARMRTDVTAYSIGVDYARALNVLAMTEKMVSAGHVATFIPFVGASARAMVEFLQKVQRAFLDYGPWLNEASAAHLGLQNGLVAAPLWNTRDLIQDFDAENFLPDYNVRMRGLKALISEELSALLKTEVKAEKVAKTVRDLEEGAKEAIPAKNLEKVQSLLKKSLPGVDLSWLLKRTGYSYKPKSGAPRVYVRDEEGTTQLERKAGGGHIVRSHDNPSGKKVHVEKGLDLDLPVDLDDDPQSHYITLIAPLVPALEPLARKDQPWIWSIAQVQVDGGDMDTFSMHSASYRPRLVPVRMSIALSKPKVRNRILLSQAGTDGEYAESELSGPHAKDKSEAELADVREALDHLPFDLSRLPGGHLLQAAFDILDIQH
jgi:hypothetical protein